LNFGNGLLITQAVWQVVMLTFILVYRHFMFSL
jgi:hypothetical protein